MSQTEPRRRRRTLTKEKIEAAVEWAYRQAIDGAPPFFASAEELANDYLNRSDSLDKAVKSLIRHQTAKASTTGFLTGLGGVITLPVAVPASLASVLFVQMRMIGAIAYMCGYDPRTDQVKTLLYMCLAGNGMQKIAASAGLDISKKMAVSGIKAIPGKALIDINKKVGFRLFTKFGQKGAVNLGKMVPLAGGAVGAAVDGSSTYTVGRAAKRLFVGGMTDIRSSN